MSMKRSQGFSFIECLVALVVFSIGLLGVSKMVNNSMQFADSASMRSQSVSLAYDLADRIRANEDNAPNYAIALGATIANPPNCSGGNCTGAQLAQADLSEWKSNLANGLPLGDGQTVITPADAAITIQWSDRGQVRNFSITVAL